MIQSNNQINGSINQTILVVDDALHDAEEIARFLHRQGFSAFTARDGNEGAAILEKEQIDLLVVDIHMPEANGIVLLERTRFELDLVIPVIVVSSDMGQRHIDYMGQFDVIEFVGKPIRPEKILRLINRSLNIEAN